MASALWTMVLLSSAMVLLAGCRFGAASGHLPVKMVWAGQQGGGPSPSPSVQWIDSQQDLDRAVGRNIAVRTAIARGGMDWSRQGLIWIRMGQQRTGGFGLQLAASEAVVQKGVAVVTVRWRRPPKGAMVTQMITSPGMVLKLPRGDYRQIVIDDQNGRERARARR